MTATVHGWCGFVEKSNDVVCQQMVLNKLWIPDVLIDIIKDYLYISTQEVLRRFYKLYLNRSITDLCTSNQMYMDMYGRDRLVVWQTGYKYGGGNLRLQGSVCVTCGDCSQLHDNLNGCCSLLWDDMEDGQIHLEEADLEVSDATIDEINAENVDDEIPEVTWENVIPPTTTALHALVVEYNYYDIEDEMADYAENYYDSEAEMEDYAEYQREVKMEAYLGRVGR